MQLSIQPDYYQKSISCKNISQQEYNYNLKNSITPTQICFKGNDSNFQEIINAKDSVISSQNKVIQAKDLTIFHLNSALEANKQLADERLKIIEKCEQLLNEAKQEYTKYQASAKEFIERSNANMAKREELIIKQQLYIKELLSQLKKFTK